MTAQLVAAEISSCMCCSTATSVSAGILGQNHSASLPFALTTVGRQVGADAARQRAVAGVFFGDDEMDKQGSDQRPRRHTTPFSEKYRLLVAFTP